MIDIPYFEQQLPATCVCACVRMMLTHLGITAGEEEIAARIKAFDQGTGIWDVPLLEQWLNEVQGGHYAEFAALLPPNLPPNRIRCLRRLDRSLLKQTRLQFSLLLAGFAGVVDAEFDSAGRGTPPHRIRFGGRRAPAGRRT